MVKVLGGYIVNQEAMVDFLKSVGHEPDAPDGTPDIVDIVFAWTDWYISQPEEACVPIPNCFEEGDKWFLAFLTRRSADRAKADVRLTEVDYDRDIRDKFIASTGNRLDASDMQFISRPQGVFRCPVAPPRGYPVGFVTPTE